MKPYVTQINGTDAPWPPEVWDLWCDRVVPLFAPDETCSLANYFTARPATDEWNRGSKMTGFVYVVSPGRHVCIKEWIA